MPDQIIHEAATKTPESFSILTYAWVLGLSVLGGAAAFARKVKEGNARAWNFAEFLGEVVISALAGLVTFFLCEWSNFHPMLSAALIAIAGHMGSRAIFRFEGLLEDKFQAKKNIDDEHHD